MEMEFYLKCYCSNPSQKVDDMPLFLTFQPSKIKICDTNAKNEFIKFIFDNNVVLAV